MKDESLRDRFNRVRGHCTNVNDMTKQVDEIMANARKIVGAIREKHGVGNDYVPKKDIVGSVPCPVCKKGTMAYSISSYNGHRHAQCSENCFGYYCE